MHVLCLEGNVRGNILKKPDMEGCFGKALFC